MSNNLGFDSVAENQANKEVTINTSFGVFDAALTETTAIDASAGSVVLTNNQYRRNMLLTISGVTTAGRTITLPTIKKYTIFRSDPTNTQSFTLIKGASTYVVAPGVIVAVYTDATVDGLVIISASAAAVSRPYDVGVFFSGVLTASEKLIRFNYVRAVDLAAGLAGSRVTAAVAATATADFDVRKNGSSIGTIRFAAAGTVATFVGISATSFVANDLLEVVAPGTPDATLADVSFTIAGVQV